MEAPNLIENNAKNYLFNTLKQCHSTRVSIYYYVLNFGILSLFLGVTCLVLYYCNKEKMTEYERHQKMVKDQEYVLSKIRYYKDENQKMQQSRMSSITNLPFTNMNENEMRWDEMRWDENIFSRRSI